MLADYDAGTKPTDLAKQYHVDRSWVYKLIKQRREAGHLKPLKGVRGPRPKLQPYQEQLKRIVAERPDATLDELRQQLAIRVGVSTLCRALHALKLTLKKSPSCR